MPNGDTHTRILAVHPRAMVPKAHEMLANAKIFLSDARALGAKGSAGQFFLYAHAIELGLKSFLHLHGMSLEDLRRNYSHKLFKAAEAARLSGLGLAPDPADDVIRRLDSSLEGAALRYDFSFELPSLNLMDRVAAEVLNGAKAGQMIPHSDD